MRGCRGLSTTSAAHDYVRIARLLCCMLELLKNVKPVSMGGNGAAAGTPRDQDMTLFETLLEATTIHELFQALQRLMPAHTPSEVTGEPCSCCTPASASWREPVIYEDRAASNAAASTSSASASAPASCLNQ